eukprot:1181537-Prorocentrum_minimum.AAC.4
MYKRIQLTLSAGRETNGPLLNTGVPCRRLTRFGSRATTSFRCFVHTVVRHHKDCGPRSRIMASTSPIDTLNARPLEAVTA